MMWKDLPPLASLRAFEAAARLRNLSAAGRELGVTHAAVAQQVKALEGRLGATLTFREGRGLGLTPEGAALSAQLTEGFGIVAAAIRRHEESRRGRPLRVSMTPGFANDWLMPRLGGFWAKHPDIAITLHPTAAMVDLIRDDIDVAVRYGRGPWPGVASEMLVLSSFQILGTPALTGGRPLAVADLARLPFVVPANWADPLIWMAELGLPVDHMRITTFENEELTRAACRKGYGLMVELAAIMTEDVALGRLTPVHTGTTGGMGYHIVTLPGRETPQIRRFIRWLRAEAGIPTAG